MFWIIFFTAILIIGLMIPVFIISRQKRDRNENSVSINDPHISSGVSGHDISSFSFYDSGSTNGNFDSAGGDFGGGGASGDWGGGDSGGGDGGGGGGD
jgi:uncharacterized membrane protein YgcG